MKIRYGLIAVLLLTLVACVSTDVIPYTGGLFTVVSSASSKKQASILVMNKANGICEQQKAVVTTIDQDIVYHGISEDQQKLIKIARDILPETKTADPYTPPDHEYESILTFRCE